MWSWWCLWTLQIFLYEAFMPGPIPEAAFSSCFWYSKTLAVQQTPLRLTLAWGVICIYDLFHKCLLIICCVYDTILGNLKKTPKICLSCL